MKQYKIREVYKDKEEVREKQPIKLGENDLIRILEIYKKENFEDFIEEIIKVDLPKNEQEALEMLEKGIVFKKEKYVNLATTVGLMKKDSIDEYINYSGEYFFIKDTYKDFVEEFENVISLGKLKTKEKEKLCINKDIVARVSLAFSTGERVHIPGIKKAILPEMTYTYVNNYLQFAHKDLIENGKVLLDKNGEPKKVIDLDKFRLVEHPNKPVEHIAMDGSGFIMPHLIDKIKEELNKQDKKIDYPLSWVGIREIGTASKGLLVKFDFKKYLKEEHGLDKLIVKDMWGHDVDLFEIDVIMNESQVKWGKWFNSHKEIEDLIKGEEYTSYKELFEGFNIVKYNKKEPKAYTDANYQIITNLALTPNELDRISKETEETYEKVIKADIDATRIMLGDVTREEEDILSASTKIHKLLQLDHRLIKIQSAKKVRESLIDKKINNLAGGKVCLKGNYKTMCHDAISYIESLVSVNKDYSKYIYKNNILKGIKGELSNKGLEKNTIYVNGEYGDRTLARCPLNSQTEIVKTRSNKIELYEKYFNGLSSDIVFIPFDDMAMRMSGADFDLDITFVIDEEKIYNAVIDDIDEKGEQWYFRNQFDGGSSEEIYTRNNMYKQVIKCRGNRIGELSNKGAIISNLIQEMPYKRVIDGKLNSYSKMKEEVVGDTLKDNLKLGLNKGTILDYKNISDNEIKEFILKNFQEYKVYSYFTLYLQMVAIDFPKTGIDVKVEEEDILGQITKGKRKPTYVYYAKYKTKNKQVKYDETSYSNTLLNNYCSRIMSNLGYKARSAEDSKYNPDILFEVMLENNNAKFKKDLFDSITNIYNKYLYLRDSIPCIKRIKELSKQISEVEKYDEIKNLENLRKNASNDIEKKEITKKLKIVKKNIDTDYLMKLKDELSKLKEERLMEYNKIDLDIAEKVNQIKEGYTEQEVLRALYEIKGKSGNRINSRFIIEFCFEELEKHLLNIRNNKLESYKVDEDGYIRYMYQLYKIIDAKGDNVNLSERDIYKKKEKIGLTKTCRLIKLTYNSLTNKVEIKGNQVINSKSELLGKLTKKNIEDGIYEVEKYDYTTATNNVYNKAKSLEMIVLTA